MKILVAGTPGVGKTTLSNRIAQKVGIAHIDITEFIRNNNLAESTDDALNTLLFDEKVVKKKLKQHLEKLESFIIDTHSPSVAASICFDHIFHIICDTKTIGKRLDDRGYSEEKISINLECELFNVVGEELDEIFGENIYVINSSDVVDERTNLVFDDVFKILGLTE